MRLCSRAPDCADWDLTKDQRRADDERNVAGGRTGRARRWRLAPMIRKRLRLSADSITSLPGWLAPPSARSCVASVAAACCRSRLMRWCARNASGSTASSLTATGKRIVRDRIAGGLDEAEELGKRLAEQLLAQGAGELLAEDRKFRVQALACIRAVA